MHKACSGTEQTALCRCFLTCFGIAGKGKALIECSRMVYDITIQETGKKASEFCVCFPAASHGGALRTAEEKVKQKMPCFFNKLFCVILCILSSTNRPPAKAPPVACVLSCYFRVLCVRFSLKYERAGAARPPPPSTRPAPCSHSARLKPFAGSCSSRFGFA